MDEQGKQQADDGERVRLIIADERFYLMGFRAKDGGLDFMVTVPDENKATTSTGAGRVNLTAAPAPH